MVKLKHVNCPVCGKQLINCSLEEELEIGYNEFWCDQCHADIVVKIPTESEV